MQCHIIARHQAATTAATATTVPLRPPVAVLLLDNVTPGQQPSYLMQVIGESMVSQVLAEFDDLLTEVKHHAVTLEAAAVRGQRIKATPWRICATFCG